MITQHKRKATTSKNEDIVMVMPNPFHDKSNIHVYTCSDYPLELNLFDLSGKLLKQTKLNSSVGWNVITVTKEDVRNPGMYLYELKTRDKSFNGKLILVR